MNKLGWLLVAGLGLSMSGCMSSGVVDMGHDKYAVSFSSLGGGANARAWAYQVATDKCREEGRELYQLSENYSEVRGSATSTVIFSCLAKGDPRWADFRNYTN